MRRNEWLAANAQQVNAANVGLLGVGISLEPFVDFDELGARKVFAENPLACGRVAL